MEKMGTITHLAIMEENNTIKIRGDVMKFNFKSTAIKVLLPIVTPFVDDIVKAGLLAVFNGINSKEPELAKQAVASGYPWIDGELEKLAEKTETGFDDALVKGAKGACEEFARENNFVLPNVDDD